MSSKQISARTETTPDIQMGYDAIKHQKLVEEVLKSESSVVFSKKQITNAVSNRKTSGDTGSFS